MISTLAIRALANERRLQILEWLKNPTKHFPPQVDGDLVKDGVCGCLIAVSYTHLDVYKRQAIDIV